MMFNAESTNWSLQQNPVAFNQFQPRPTQQRIPSATTTFPKQSNDTRMSRRYSSGTPTNLQQTGFSPIVQQPLNARRLNNKSTFRSATFHNPQQTPLPPQQFPISNSPTNRSVQPQKGGQLRPSSSFHGCIQHQTPQNVYSGRSSYNGAQLMTQQAPKQNMYNVNGQFNPGMKDVPVWLKSLRLHKYTRMFQEMSYEEMMKLDDQKLEQRQVTKGARKKILQSLDKLRDRSQLIRQLEKCIDEHGDVRCLIVELRAMMCTPIAAYKPADLEPYTIDAIGMAANEVEDENLPGHISRLCLRLHEFLFRNGLPQIHELGIEDEYLVKLLQVYDRICSNEAFTFRQRYFINECKRILSRYMMEQKIAMNAGCLPFGTQTAPSSAQPTLVSSPSSGYHTMSPPSSSTRRNSDTKESVDDLTATATTATNSDDDGFHNLSSAPASPPSQHLNFQQFQQTQQMRQSAADQWTHQLPQTQSPKSSQCPPPGFEWIQNGQTGRNVAATNPHFQPYVNAQQFEGIGSIGSIPQQKTQLGGWYNQQVPETFGTPSTQQRVEWRDKQLDAGILKSMMLDSDSDLYGYLIQHLQQQQRQNPTTASVIKPPKAPSPIGTRPSGYTQKPDSSADPLQPLTVADKIRFLASDAAGSEILENAVQEAMKQLKMQKQRNESVGPAQTQPILWQNIKEQPKQQNWWNTAAPKQHVSKPQTYSSQVERRSSGSNNFYPINAGKPKVDYYDHWSHLQIPTTTQDLLLSSSDQLTTSTSSNLSSDANLFQNGSNSSSSTRLTQNYPSLNQLVFDPLTSTPNDAGLFQSTLSNSSSSTRSTYPMTSLGDTNLFQVPVTRPTHVEANRPQPNNQSQFDSNFLNRMLNDNNNGTHQLLCGGQSQKQQQRIMQQYAVPEDLSLSDRGLFSTRAEDLRAMLTDHSQEHLFAAFKPLACNASGAVH